MGISAFKIDKALSKKDGQRMAAAVTAELNNVSGIDIDSTASSPDRIRFVSPLQKVAFWKEGSDVGAGAIIVYNYAVHPVLRNNTVNIAEDQPSVEGESIDDGTYAPFNLRAKPEAIAGIDYFVVTVARKFIPSSGGILSETGYVQDATNFSILGNVFLVKIREYIEGSGSSGINALELSGIDTYGEIITDIDPEADADGRRYTVEPQSDGLVNLQLELYKLPTNGNGSPNELINYLNSESNFDKFQDIQGRIRPDFKENIAIGLFRR